MKKENITIETTKDEFNTMFDEVIILKDKIEKEMENINKKFEETLKAINNYFIIKHEELIKEENGLVEKMQSEVKNVKEKVKIFLFELNEQIKLSNRITENINKLDKEENNYLKNIVYVSKMKESIKNMNKIITKPLKNIRFFFQEEKRDVNYEQYYINEEILKKCENKTENKQIFNNCETMKKEVTYSFIQQIQPIICNKIQPVITNQAKSVVRREIEPVISSNIQPIIQRQTQPVFKKEIQSIIKREIQPVISQPITQKVIQPVIPTEIQHVNVIPQYSSGKK